MPYREAPRFRSRGLHGPLDPETEIRIIQDALDRGADNFNQLWNEVQELDDRLGRVERIRELVWEMVRFLFKDGLKVAVGIILMIMLLSGHVSIDQLIKLVQALASLFHGEASHLEGGG